MILVLGLFFGMDVLYADDVADALKESSTAHELFQKAEACLPEKTAKGIHFCTGFDLSTSEWNRIRQMDMASCQQEIERRGYRVKRDVAIPGTRRAETDSGTRVVTFRSEADRVDCVHELLHVHQWTSTPARSDLAPPSREKRAFKLAELLEKSIQQIEILEKQNKKFEAKQLGDRIQPAVDIYRDWRGMSDWLDEKEVHSVILENCADLKCSEEDRDVALSNLLRLKDKLPKRYREKIVREALASLHKKESAAVEIVRKNWIPISEKESEAARKLLAKSESKALEILKSQGVQVIQSKTLEAKLNGKFLCQDGKPTILLRTQVKAKILAKAYLHYFQSKKNPGYCTAIMEQGMMAEKFKKGELRRQDYESQVLNAQAMDRLANAEVKKILNE